MIRKFPENLRPFTDEEIPHAMQRIAAHQYFYPIARLIFPGITPEDTVRDVLSVKTIEDFQMRWMYAFNRRVIETTMDSFTFHLSPKIKPGTGYLFVSNHRDIILDSSLLQMVLVNSGLPTSMITYGDNLIINQLAEDLARSNKMFKVVRQGNKRELFKNSLVLSDFMRTCVKEGHSCWIAQRNGRTKDGLDQTSQALIKMLAMSGPRKDPVSNYAELNIVPVSISYEYEPCDFLKVRELLMSRLAATATAAAAAAAGGAGGGAGGVGAGAAGGGAAGAAGGASGAFGVAAGGASGAFGVAAGGASGASGVAAGGASGAFGVAAGSATTSASGSAAGFAATSASASASASASGSGAAGSAATSASGSASGSGSGSVAGAAAHVAQDAVYVKQEGEDLISIVTGITQLKGNVHLHIGDPITREQLEDFYSRAEAEHPACEHPARGPELSAGGPALPADGAALPARDNDFNAFAAHVCTLIDTAIAANYKIFPTHHIAYDLLQETAAGSPGGTAGDGSGAGTAVGLGSEAGAAVGFGSEAGADGDDSGAGTAVGFGSEAGAAGGFGSEAGTAGDGSGAGTAVGFGSEAGTAGDGSGAGTAVGFGSEAGAAGGLGSAPASASAYTAEQKAAFLERLDMLKTGNIPLIPQTELAASIPFAEDFPGKKAEIQQKKLAELLRAHSDLVRELFLRIYANPLFLAHYTSDVSRQAEQTNS